ncbi:hypothetical protein MSSD1_42 [Mycoplasmopsis synoviae]
MYFLNIKDKIPEINGAEKLVPLLYPSSLLLK